MESNPVMFWLTVALGLGFAVALGALFLGILCSLEKEIQTELSHKETVPVPAPTKTTTFSTKGEKVPCRT